MDGMVSLGRAGRKRLLGVYRRHPNPDVRRRAHGVLLLGMGWSGSRVAEATFCSRRTIALWKRRYEEGGLDALMEERRGRRRFFGAWLATFRVACVTTLRPRNFGFVRSRWTCECLAALAFSVMRVRVSRETVRRRLHDSALVWHRPRPVVRLVDPRRGTILRDLRQWLRDLPEDEIAVFQDEVDVNTNPKIGSMWMRRGEQAEVETPGDNEKRYLAGSLNWRTGDLILTEGAKGEGRNSKLFLRHWEDLRTRLRCYRRIHVICDNAIFHKSRAVREYLAAHGDRIILHFLPKRAPDLNPIERIGWHLHEAITRNHTCPSMAELLDLVFDWLEHRRPFEVERDAYLQTRAA